MPSKFVKAARTVIWSREPEMTAWMLEHDGGRPTSEVSKDFEKVFGFPLNQPQVSGFRSSHGTQTRHGGRFTSRSVEVGTAVVGKDGYLKYKRGAVANVPGSKDNWSYIHRDVFESWHGPLEEGYVVRFADGDKRNFDPYNLVAVPRSVLGQLCQFEYHDRESLELAILQCLLQSKIREKRFVPRKCAICGKEFDPDAESASRTKPNKCCKECISRGKYFTSMFVKADKGEAVCPICGATFQKKSARQRRCKRCIDENPHHSVEAVLRKKGLL